MGTPKCEVCNEKVDWVNRDYEFLNIEVHKKCLDKFHIEIICNAIFDLEELLK